MPHTTQTLADVITYYFTTGEILCPGISRICLIYKELLQNNLEAKVTL